MISVESAAGTPIYVSGAALAGGPVLGLSAGRRLDDIARASAAGVGGFPSWFHRAAAAGGARSAQGPQKVELAVQREVLPAQWGRPAFYGDALNGPPYELENRTAEWTLSAETLASFRPVNTQSRMALRVHPRGPALQTAGSFLATLYGTTPTPRHLGVGLDAMG
jgi:hypothetical protein